MDGKAPTVIPDMPATRPKNAMTMTADKPISPPPNKEAQGVNSVMVDGGIARFPLAISSLLVTVGSPYMNHV